MEGPSWDFNLRGTPYMFSNVHNKFTVVGCNTFAYIADDANGLGYQSVCVSTCHNLSDIADGSCAGMGCCQTAIPKGMDLYYSGFAQGFNTSQIWNFSRCSYAVLMEAEAFNFSTAYITTTEFNDTSSGQVPVVVDWAIRNGSMPCEVAKQKKEGTYACLSDKSECVDSLNGPGYLCNCSKGYEGNPYLPDGCHDVDECKNSPCPSGGICHNTVGSYRCSCRVGRKLNGKGDSCDPDIALIIAGGATWDGIVPHRLPSAKSSAIAQVRYGPTWRGVHVLSNYLAQHQERERELDLAVLLLPYRPRPSPRRSRRPLPDLHLAKL
nr:unnamed protein product [Digitaria exilis]